MQKEEILKSLDTEAKTISGSVKIKLTNTSEDTLSQICFRDYISAIGRTYGEMNGTSLDLESKFTGIYDVSSKETLEYSRTDKDKSILFVDLKSPLAPGKSTQIQFDYKADIPENAFRYLYTTVNDGKNLLFELGNFYPILSIYENGDWQNDSFFYEGECFCSKCADYSVTLSLPEEYTLVSSGTEKQGKAENGMCTWTIEAENVRDVGITASDNIAFSEDTFEDIQIRCYYFDNEASKKQGELMLDTAVNSVKFLTQHIGGYPYPTLDAVMTNDLIGAIEFPSYVRVGDYSEQMDGDNSEYITNLIVENTSHEVAHQWFYAVVGNNGYQDPWLDESLASFCALAYQSEKMSQKDVEELVSQGKLYLQDTDGIYLNESYDKLGQNYIAAVYEKGKYFLFDLMHAMGEEEFYKMLQEYYSTNAYQEVQAKDFIDMIHKYTKTDKVKELVKANLKE